MLKRLVGHHAQVAGLLCAALAAPLEAPVQAAEKPTKRLEKFRDEIARYIITDDERDAWSKLDTNVERAAFAESFWLKRDPTPGTPENEYRDEHMRRIQACNRHFRGEGRPGWLTDRGRVYIIFGPPDEIQEDSAGSVLEGNPTFAGGGGSGGGIDVNRRTTRGRITFIYRSPDNPNLGPNTSIRFVSTSGSTYKLDSDVNASAQSAYFSGQLGRTTRDDVIQRAKTLEDIKTRTPTPVAAERAPRPTPAATILSDLSRGVLPDDIPHASFKASVFPVGQAKLYVNILFDHAWHNQASELARLRLYPDAPGLPPLRSIDLKNELQGRGTRSFGLMLDPGKYRLTVAFESSEGAVEAVMADDLVVPDLNRGLVTSSVVLARGAEQRASGTVDMDKLEDKLVLGNFELDARTGNSIAHGQNPYVIYLVNGAGTKPTGELQLEIDYAVRRSGEIVKSYSELSVNTAFVAHPLPLGELEPGSYSLELVLRDRIAERQLEQSVPFEVQ